MLGGDAAALRAAASQKTNNETKAVARDIVKTFLNQSTRSNTRVQFSGRLEAGTLPGSLLTDPVRRKYGLFKILATLSLIFDRRGCILFALTPPTR